MPDLLLPVLLVAFLGVLFFLLLRAVDREELRQSPTGLVSPRGAAGIVGGGFVAGFLWGLATGWGGGPALGFLRGLAVGLLLACAGALYVGGQQRAQRRRRRRGGRGEG